MPVAKQVFTRWLGLAVVLVTLLSGCGGSGEIPPPTVDPLVVQGQQVFNLNCASCHATSPDTVILGPSLYGVATRAAELDPGGDAARYLRAAILDPAAEVPEGFPNAMPSDLGRRLSAEDLDALIVYLMTLR